GDAERLQQRPRPESGRHDDMVGGDESGARCDAGDAPALGREALDRNILADDGAAASCRGGISRGQVRRVDAAGERVEPGGGEPGRMEEGIEPACLVALDPARGDAALLRRPVEPLEAAAQPGAAGEEEPAGLEPAGGEPELALEPVDRLERIDELLVMVRRR